MSSTQTEQPTATDVPAGQPTHHYVMTIQKQLQRGVAVATFNNAVPIPSGWTRGDVFRQLYREFTTGEHASLAGGQVLFFSLERDQL